MATLEKDGQVTFCIRLKQDLLTSLRVHVAVLDIKRFKGRCDFDRFGKSEKEATLPASTDSQKVSADVFGQRLQSDSETWTSTI